MKAPFKYQDDHERIQAGHEKNKQMSWLAGHVERIIKTHEKTQKGVLALGTADMNLINMVLNVTICNIFHDMAEQAFLLKAMGVDDAEANG